MIFQENLGTFDLNKHSWKYYSKIYHDKSEILKIFNRRKFDQSIGYFTIVEKNNQKYLAGKKVFCRCWPKLLDLAKQNYNLTNLFILNNAFNSRNNNNQLASTKFYYKIGKNSFEMYAGLLNHNTPNFCSFIKEESPLKCQASGLLKYFKEYTKKSHPTTQIFINPPFDEESIRFAQDQTKKIIKLFKDADLKLQIQFTVPEWSKEDYQPGGIYHWLVENFERHTIKETFRNFWNGQKIEIPVSIFLLEI